MRHAASLAALLMLIGASSTAAQPEQAAPVTGPGGTKPTWVRAPNGEDFARYYPALAAQLGVGGRAVVHCRVSLEGVLVDCAVVEEDPPGYGFGEAALKMMPKFRMRPLVVNGVAASSGEISIPIRFGALH